MVTDTKSSSGTPGNDEDGGGSLLLPGGVEVRIPGCGLLIGRAPSCDLVLDDADASRRHALVRVFSGEAWVMDQGSTNGTLLDGNLVNRARLRRGCRLLVGSTVLGFSEDDRYAGLPPLLEGQWRDFRERFERGEADARVAEALRSLADAEICRVGTAGGVTLAWPDGEAGMDGLGPLRRELVQDALAMLCEGEAR